MKNKRIVSQIASVFVSAALIFLAHTYASGGETVFKGKAEGETIKCRVLRVVDVKTEVADGKNRLSTVEFKAQALNSTKRGKTLDVIQETDSSFALSPKRVEKGDKILVESFEENGETRYFFGDFVRTDSALWLAALFCALIILFSRSQGFKTVVSLALTCFSVFTVLIPAILNGKNIYLWSVLICAFITVTTLGIVGGYNPKTFCAGIGCVSGVLCSGLIAVIADKFLNMTGLLEEESVYLLQLRPEDPINLKAIIFAMIIVGALGAVMDVAMSISSSLYELRIKSPKISSKELLKSGFTIGGDMMGTMANTLVLAYIGSSLTSILLLISYNANIARVANREAVIAEILQAVAGSMGILLTLPLTSLACALVYYNDPKGGSRDAVG